ncbi:hypothetical protein PC9H_011690 [Pleurotus ostreatus]|uniref:RRM domain-containing protein n=1 Tax=Pleurotus ostreatus TaxID=5322 RepID=A0A8H6ZLZ0_PLEOS|nr:uncharacterized protein PC9H_011690 [Pleurotus ostreatus]KAF7421170.1 hypothetical protein PC9H_011690 [Pleurotus ostreatus]KAJ8690718.1 hypothetical protein PTI98_012123 [Pleurotus ostreatus]
MLLPIFQSTARNFSRSASRSLVACSRIAAVQSAVAFAPARQAQILGVRNISATASALEEYERRRSSEHRSSRPPRYERREPREPREAPTVPSKALFVGNIPFIAEEDDIRLAFEEFGDIESVRIFTGPDGRSKGSARVTFLSQEGATKVVERSLEEPISIFDRTTRVEYSFSSTPRNARPEPNERLFLVNWPGSESELKDAFGRFSRSITDIYFPKVYETGERNGNVFMSFNSTEEATEALEAMLGAEGPDGQPISIFYARPKNNNHNNDRGRRDYTKRGRFGV